MKGITVALIGADGAGKTTIGRELERVLPIPVKYLYMGLNYEACNELLPTTRLVRAWKRKRGLPVSRSHLTKPKPPPRNLAERLLREARALLGLTNRLAEEWFRQWIAWRHQRQGKIVVFDRHFTSDYHAHEIAEAAHERTWTRGIHAFVLTRLYPKPDLVILLDAPPEVLWARKQEGTMEEVVSRREEYLRLRGESGPLPVVDVTQSRDAVVAQVARLILARHEAGAPEDLPHAVISSRTSGTAPGSASPTV